MTETIAKYEFEELCPQIDGFHVEGMMLYGTATLASAYPDEEEHEFYVTEIELVGGLRLRGDNRQTGQHTFRGQLFKAIEAILTSDRTAHGKAAQIAFDEELEGKREGDPDRRHDERRDHQHGGMYA